MTTTYKPLTPGEALDAVIAGKRVEYAYESSDWNAAGLGFTFEAKSEKSFKYRLVTGPEPVEDALEGHRAVSVREHRSSWLRVFAALKHEIKSELREEMKR